MYKSFRTNPYFLQYYYIASTIVFISIISGLLLLKSEQELKQLIYFIPICLLFTNFKRVLLALVGSLGLIIYLKFNISVLHIILCLLAGVYTGIWSTVLIHNASHNNIKYKVLNRMVGELCGLQLLVNYPLFAIIHLEHHKHSDDFDKDPQAYENDKNFWWYINHSSIQMRQVFFYMYKDLWENNIHFSKYKKSWLMVSPLILFSKFLRVLLLLVLLGPLYFTFFFIVSHIATHLYFSGINYFTHKLNNDTDQIEILNLDKNLLSRLLNRLFAGALYHKNHHQSPKLFNPMKLKT